MITEDYVSFEIAKLLKEKGFDEYCMYFYTLRDEGREGYKSNKILEEFAHNSHTEIKERAVSCPTLQMAMKWLRKEHNLYIDVLLLESEDGDYGYVIQDITSRDYLATSKNNSYQSPEEACEEAIKYCLENLI